MGQFIATGGSDQRNLWTSTDGLTWTQINQGGGWVADCAFGNNMILAAGGFHFLSSSQDGVTWSSLGGTFTGDHMRSVAYGNGVFVAVGGSEACVTNDGETWDVETTHGADNVDRVAFETEYLLELALVVLSLFPKTMVKHVPYNRESEEWGTVFYGSSYFYIGRSNLLYRSSDGETWELVSGTSGITARGIVGGTILRQVPAFYRSDDGGFSWIELAPLVYGGGFNDFVVEGGY